MIGIRVSGGNVTTTTPYSNFQMISIKNQEASGGATATVTLNDGNTIRILAGEAWSLPYVGKPYQGITLTPGSADCDVTVVQ